MTQAARQFRVHARHGHHARLVTEPSFEAAAIAFVEDLPPVEGEADLSIVVRDVETGHEHCFRVDPETGETAPCG